MPIMLKFWGLFSFLILQVHVVTPEPLVVLPKTQVKYRGTSVGSVEHFQNIRFAHDTSGPRRFAPPTPFIPIPGAEVDASTPGAACPQTRDAMPPFFTETKEISEDCLNLRIARPQGTTLESKLPVVVWLHGGGVVKGSAYDPHFEPENMISLSKDIDNPVIYVALNYRLTIFGFARMPILKDQLSLNVGVRDQRAGFQWVKDNIENFGGDPEKITVFGLSAGGTFASLHLMAYGGERGVPFNQVWTMSGPPGTALNMSSKVTETHTAAVAKSVGCDQKEEAGVLECLRQIPMNNLLDAAMTYSVANFPPAGLFTFIPSVDDDIFPARPSVLYKAGRFVKDVPMVFGWTQDDGAMNVGPAHPIQTEEDMKPVIRNFAPALSDQDLSTIFSSYTVADFKHRVMEYEANKKDDDPVVSVHYFRLAQILRNLLFTCSSIDFGFEMSKQSRDSLSKSAGVRLYALNQSMLTPLWKGAGMPYVGVSHGSDTNYLFNLFPEGEISEGDKQLSKSLMEAFVRFASTGDPNASGDKRLEHWPEAFTFHGARTQLSGPQSLHVRIIGGPLGTSESYKAVDSSDRDEENGREVFVGEDGTQQILQGHKMGAMSTANVRLRREMLAQENLLERCSVLNSFAQKLGV